MFHILVVDDDKNTRLFLTALLEDAGYTVTAAVNGVDALEKMDRAHVDLVVLDIMMPEMDGYEFTRLIRESDANLPILMVSAKQLPADKHRGFAVGTDDYITKPIDDEEMLYRIKALLRRAKIATERRITVGEVVLDYDSFTVSKGDRVQELPQKEFLLLFKLLLFLLQLLGYVNSEKHKLCTALTALLFFRVTVVTAIRTFEIFVFFVHHFIFFKYSIYSINKFL